MEDKELFDFFKNRSASFDEMPSDQLWNIIQTNIEASEKTSSYPISKIMIWGALALAAFVIILFFIPKNAQTTIENINHKPKQNETIVKTNSSDPQTLSKSDSVIKNRILLDTLKTKKISIKKALVTHLKDTVLAVKKLQPVVKTDSLFVVDPTIIFDSLRIRPQVKGNRLLFETKQLLTKMEFDLFVTRVLKETENNYGALIVIKSKGNKPYKHIVKFPEKINIPKTTIQPSYYTSKLILKDSLIASDSIYFNLKK